MIAVVGAGAGGAFINTKRDRRRCRTSPSAMIRERLRLFWVLLKGFGVGLTNLLAIGGFVG
jgi:hypothetical protein